VFNLEEVGISDWEDRKTKRVIVPAAMPGQTTRHEVSRNVKPVSVIACLPAARESLLHFIAISQISSTVQEHLNKQIIHFGMDFALTFNQKRDFNAGIFFDDVRSIFLPYIDTFRDLALFAHEITVLLMVNCSDHISDYIIRILTEARVFVITFASHTTQVFHLLVITLFGFPRRCPRSELPFDDDNATVRVIMKVYHDFTQRMVPANVWRAFRALGSEFYTRTESERLLIDEINLRESVGFEQLCFVDSLRTTYGADDVLIGPIGSNSLSKSI
jgi:hypothetical protein